MSDKAAVQKFSFNVPCREGRGDLLPQPQNRRAGCRRLKTKMEMRGSGMRAECQWVLVTVLHGTYLVLVLVLVLVPSCGARPDIPVWRGTRTLNHVSIVAY